MRIAIVGCGYVADLYMSTRRLHPELEIVGAMDCDPPRAESFGNQYDVRRFDQLEELLSDERIEMVLNLTNPSSHYQVSRAALEAGKHVYSEKPLAMDIEHARRLVDLAKQQGLRISSAPSSVLGETAQTVWKALREGSIGSPRLVYAELDDGMLHKMPYDKWLSARGIAWPYKDEFEVGCTLEHAAYYLSWLAAWYGPAESITAFASMQIPDKQSSSPLDVQSPDFSVACLRYGNGVVARLTCSIVAQHDHRLRIFGEDGVLSVKDGWLCRSPVQIRRWVTIRRTTLLSPRRQRYRLVGLENPPAPRQGATQMDYFRGVAELADAVREDRPSRLSPEFCLHITELALTIHSATADGVTHRPTTSFDPVEPMPWAKD